MVRSFLTACLAVFALGRACAQSGWSWRNPLPQGHDLQDLHFTDAGHGIAVGDFGAIYKTEDGGETWSRQLGATETLFSLSFRGPDTGWAAGDYGIILKSISGGSDRWIPFGLRSPGCGTNRRFRNGRGPGR